MLKLEEKFAQESLKTYADGEIIFQEGDDSREMYIVTEGQVVIHKKTRKDEVELAVLQRGDFLGEMSLLESLPRSATARARGATQLLAIQPGGFLLKIRRDPTFAFEMLQCLSHRIRITNDKLAQILSHDTVSRAALEGVLSQSEFDQKTPIVGRK